MKRKEIFVIFLFVMLDQVSKFCMETYFSNPLIIIPSFFSFHYVKNTGAAWSIFSGARIFLILMSIGALFLLFSMRYQTKMRSLTAFFYDLLCAGIMGNLIDRIVFGYVRDFLSLQFFQYSFPVFNLADVFIVIGCFFFVGWILLGKDRI